MILRGMVEYDSLIYNRSIRCNVIALKAFTAGSVTIL